jgi:hypothetical protein
VLDIALPGLAVKKGFLAQAKRFWDRSSLPADERERLRGQCGAMLKVSPDSFVFFYRRDRITVVPAIDAQGADDAPHGTYTHSMNRFLKEFFGCFVGDGRLGITIDLTQPVEAAPADNVLYLRGEAG